MHCPFPKGLIRSACTARKTGQEGKLRAIELNPIAAKADIAKRSVLCERILNGLKGKIRCHVSVGEWGYPMHGPAKKWPAMIDDFDVDRFAKLVAEETELAL